MGCQRCPLSLLPVPWCLWSWLPTRLCHPTWLSSSSASPSLRAPSSSPFSPVVAHNLFASSITAIELKKSLFLTIGFIFLGAGYLGLQLREDINRAKVAPYAAAASAATAVAFIAFPPVSLPLAVAFAAQAVAFAFNM